MRNYHVRFFAIHGKARNLWQLSSKNGQSNSAMKG
jgi:hypothetical protein